MTLGRRVCFLQVYRVDTAATSTLLRTMRR